MLFSEVCVKVPCIDLVHSRVPDVCFDASQTRIQAFLQQQQTQSGCFCKLHASTHEEIFIFVALNNLPLPNTYSEKVKVKVEMTGLMMSFGQR